MANLQTKLCGVELPNPLIVSSGPLSYSAAGIQRCFAAGAAGAVTKTISEVAAENPRFHIVDAGRGTMLNTEKWADLPPEQWAQVEFPALAGADGLVIASLGHTVEVIHKVLPQLLETTGIQMFEIVSYRAEDMAPMTRLVKSMTNLPLLAKMSPNWPNLSAIVDACVDAGADGITAADSLGPTLKIDIEKARPALGGDYGYAWMSGSAIKPIVVRIVADICRRHPGLPVVATGGVSDAEDVVEMLMVGATAVGVHTAPLLRGIDWVGKTAKKLGRWLDEHGFDSPAAIKGLALPALVEGEDKTPLPFAYHEDRCTECGRCVTVCAYEARLMNGKNMYLDREACRSCGLCVSVCPVAALVVAD